MKCYTIAEEVCLGFEITNALDDEPSLYIGADTSARVRVGRHAAIIARAAHIDRARSLLTKIETPALRKYADKELRSLLRTQRRVDPFTDEKLKKADNLDQEEAHLRYAEVWAKEDKNRIVIVRGELGAGEPYGPIYLLEETTLSSTKCLVHVTTQAVPGGKLWYEWEDRQPIPSNTCATVVARGKGPSGEEHLLLVMQRGAYFRIHRDGDLGADSYNEPIPRTLIVQWDGSTLQCSPEENPQSRVA